MNEYLERRFTRLAIRRKEYGRTLELFRERYAQLFDALAIEMGYDRMLLARQLGFGPVPKGGNQIMNGHAPASHEDCLRLLDMYLDHKGIPYPKT